MSWKEYSLEDGSKIYFSHRNNLVLSVQYNSTHKNWHYCCWDRNNENVFLVDTERNPIAGFIDAIIAKNAANTWYKEYTT